MAETEKTPEEILQEMQKLTDVEADLADTALVVAAAPTAPSTSTEGDSNERAEASTTLLDNAEQMESILEENIPDAPAAAESNPQPTKEGEIPGFGDAGLVDGIPSSDAVEADIALQVVASDIDQPILPESTIVSGVAQPETIDQPLSLDHPKEDEPMSIDTLPVDPPVIPTPAVTATNGTIPVPIPAHLLPTETYDIASNPSTPRNETSPLEIKPQLESSTSKVLTPLPTGISHTSPSAQANPHLVRAYQDDPTDTHAVLSLFEWAISKTEINDARAWYTIIAADSPTATKPLLALVNLELALTNFVQVEQLFATALRGPSGNATASADANVWKAYLHYIRRQHLVKEDAPNYDQVRGTVAAAYDYALKECGFDRESGDIWQEYIAYLNEPKPKNTWDAQKQMDEVRKTYQKAVCIPLNNVETLWKSYDAFESGLNKLTAKKFLADKSPAYMTARTALRDLRNLTDKLPFPALPPHPNFSDEDRRIVASWKAYLKWEESNPLVISDDDTLAARVGYALRKCLGQMRHFPELWHYAAYYYLKRGKTEEAVEFLQAGIQACPKSFLLTFALADLEESRTNLKIAHEAYENLLNLLSTDIDLLKKTVETEVENAKGPSILSDNDNEDTSKLIEERENRGKTVAERRGRDVEDLQGHYSVVWIMYMRFARRAEGIKSARLVFSKARKSAHATWHSYEASALMEYHSNKEAPVAIRIFELGLKIFSEEVNYVISYLQFLLSINDDTNARALFERSALKIPAEKARPLWDSWARYEYMYGDLSAVQKLEVRFSEVFPNDPPLKRFAQRFIYNGIDAIAQRDLGFRSSSSTSLPAPSSNIAPSQVAPPNPAQQIYKRNVPSETPPPHGNNIQQANSPLKREFTDNRERSPENGGPYKRQRPASPTGYRRSIPPVGGYPGGPPGVAAGGGGYKERSPLPPQGMPGRGNERLSAPPGGVPLRDQIDRSGLTAPLAIFIGSLPTTRSFEACAGPIFRPDDIMGLFSSISREGNGNQPPRGGYAPEPERYRVPPPVRGRGY